MRFFPAFVLCAGLAATAYSQAPVDQFAAEPAVLLRSDYIAVMQADGTGYRERTFAVRIQSEAAVHEFSVLSFPFAGASEHVDVHYLRVRRADGTVVETPASDAQEQPTAVTREAPFYSDQKEKQIPVRSLRMGDTLEWQVRDVRTKAEAPGQFWDQDAFSDTLVTLEESAELHVPRTMKVNVWTNPDEAKPVETTVGDERVYTWHHHNLKPTVGSVAEVEKEDRKRHTLTPEEELDAREGKLPSYAWSTFATWAQVGEWYRGLERERHTPDADIKAKVAELTAGKTTEEAKVQAVYDYTALQVRYVGVAFGIGRYQPHMAGEVLANQYGDCKDKHTLLAAMLAALGLKPDAVLIGQGIRFNEALPSPGAFNHLITQVTLSGKPVWLDATAETAPYRLLLYPIRDKQALVIPDEGAARLERTPKDPPFAPFEKMTAEGTLDRNGVSESHLVLTLRGDEEAYVRMALRQLAPAKYDEFVQALANGLGYSGTTSHASFSQVTDTATPLAISFDYHREKAGDWDNYRTVPQLLPVGLGPVDENDPPKQSIALGVPMTRSSTAQMKLPEGWGAELPEAVHAKTDFATYDQTYRLEKGTVYSERTLTILKERIPARDWHQYKVWGDQVNLGGEPYIQLTRVGVAPDKAAPSKPAPGKKLTLTEPPSAAGFETEKLVRQGYDALKSNDVKQALALLDKAKAMNAEQRGLWSAYAMAAEKEKKHEEAIADLQHELELHPELLPAYATLAAMQQMYGHSADLPETLRAWVKADPEDPKPVAQLLAVLNESGKPGEAMTVAQKALETLPEGSTVRPYVRVQLAEAQMKSGATDAGVAGFQAIIKESTDPGTLNSAAYELADADKELPLADATERGLLGQLDGETRTWTGNESMETIANKSRLLFASWDTMGWILFREGKLKDAEAYVDAAFLNRPNSEVGTHLGDLRAAAGDPTSARRAYLLSIAAIPYRYGMADGSVTKGVRESLEAKAEAMKKAGARVEPAGDLDDLRKVHLGPANGRNLSAEYRILLAPGKVVSAEPAGEKSVRGGSEMILAMKLPHVFPAGSDARLVKLAILNCHAETCDLIFEP